MTPKHLIVLPLLLICLSIVVFPQDKFGHLKSWDGKTPTEVDGQGQGHCQLLRPA